jgi:hypothetical protein
LIIDYVKPHRFPFMNIFMITVFLHLRMMQKNIIAVACRNKSVTSFIVKPFDNTRVHGHIPHFPVSNIIKYSIRQDAAFIMVISVSSVSCTAAAVHGKALRL